MLNDTVSAFVEEGLQTLSLSDIGFGIKLLAFFGALYLFSSVMKSGVSIIKGVAYLIGIMKWFREWKKK